MLAPRSATTPATVARPLQLQQVDKPPNAEQSVAEVRSGTPQGVSMQRTASKGVADQGIIGKWGANQPSRGLKVEAGQSSKQSSLGRQLGDALKLCNWKASRQTGSRLPVNNASLKPAVSLSPRTESAMMVAASELGFDARQAEHLEAAAQPTSLLASQSHAAGSALHPLFLDC